MALAKTEGQKIKKLPSFRIFRGAFSFRLIPALIALAMLAILIGLGVWQIQRLHWKEGLIAEIHERMQEPQIDVGLSVIPPEDIPNFDYRPGRASGLFQNDHAFYLTAISINGDGGYDLLTPLALDNGSVLLVNRGWIPYTAKGQASNVEDRDTGVGDQGNNVYRPAGPVTVTGILHLPPAQKPYGRPANDADKNDEWTWIDLPAMATAAGVKEFLPYVLEADDAPHDGAWPVGGQTRIDLPNNHLNYAITWFALAGILPFIWFLSGWRPDRPKKVEEDEKSAEDKPA